MRDLHPTGPGRFTQLDAVYPDRFEDGSVKLQLVFKKAYFRLSAAHSVQHVVIEDSTASSS